MDDKPDDSKPTNCIVLYPDKLAKLGVTLENTPFHPSSEHDSHLECVRHGKVIDSLDVSSSPIAKNLQNQSNFASGGKSSKDITNSKERPSHRLLCPNETVKNHTLKKSNSTNSDNNGEDLKNKTNDNIESTDDTLPCFPVHKLIQSRRIIKPSAANDNWVDADVMDNKLSFDHVPMVKKELYLLESDKHVAASKDLQQNYIDSDSTPAKNSDQKTPLCNDLNGTFKDTESAEVRIEPGVQKRGRGRPRKYVPIVDLNSSGVCENTSKNRKEISQGSDISLEKISIKARKKNPNIIDSDLEYNNSDSDNDNESHIAGTSKTKKRRKGAFKNKRIIDSDDSDIDSPGGDDLTHKHVKIETGDSNSKDQLDNTLESANESTICGENKLPKKRGRPKKNSLEASKTDVSPRPVKEPELDESVVTVSKRGRKRKGVNYSLIENADFLENESNSETIVYKQNTVSKRGRPKKNSLDEYIENKAIDYNLSSDIKIEAEGIEKVANADENNELSLNNGDEQVHETSHEINDASKKRYRKTGNLNKAINHMFSVIKDSSNPNICADNSPDEEGSSVCMVCKESMPDTQWPKHKQKVHYNLAWRKGDMPMDLSNEGFVLKTFKQLTQEQGFIKCRRCSKKIKKAKQFVDHLEVCNGVVDSSGCVTCAVCKSTVGKKSWPQHNYRQHNNLAWREGDPPLDLEDQDLVLRILNALYKTRKPLHCEKCDQQKKSVLGYLSHKSSCQKTDEELANLRVTCEQCGKKVLPVSMDYHLKAHEEREKLNSTSSTFFDVNVDGIGKRKAAKQALRVISSISDQVLDETKYYISQCDFQDSFVSDVLRKRLSQQSSLKCLFQDCHFISDEVESMINHMNSCERKPNQYFLCKVCLFCCKEKSDIFEHIRAQHNKSFKGDEDIEFQSEDESEGDEEEDRERKRLQWMGKQKILSQSNIRVKPLFLVHPIRECFTLLLYRQAYVWMSEFCEINYKRLDLYPYLRNDRPFHVLDCDILNDYLPRNSQSCDIASKKITSRDNPDDLSHEFSYKKLDLFEVSNLYEGDTTIYCGGPINALAWLPTPFNQKNHNQILAVAVFNSMESRYTTDKNYHEPSIIQFWDFGKLDCHEQYVSKPHLLFGMAVTCGPIWHLEWCPSGCLDSFEVDTTCRLGLLAIAASDSCVYIYSIDNFPEVNDRGFIYKGDPVLKLQLESDKSTLEGQSYYATKISWSKAEGHRYIAVGYSSGLVALYDLLSESRLLQRGDKSGTHIVFPYNSFQAHYSSITALTLSHLSGGNRLLFSLSFDRTSVYWDLSTMTKITPFKRNTASDGVWATQWPTYVVVEDESTFNDKAKAHSYIKPLRYFMSPEGSNFTFSTSGIRTLSFSDWLNAILHGNNAGEVITQFSHRMFCGVDSKRLTSKYVKCLLSVTKLVQNDSFARDVAVTYDEVCNKYKMIFLDYNLNNLDDIPNSAAQDKLNPQHLSKFDVSEYGLQSISKLAVNPNPQACSYFAVGYQAGFLRLKCLQLVSPILKKF